MKAVVVNISVSPNNFKETTWSVWSVAQLLGSTRKISPHITPSPGIETESNWLKERIPVPYSMISMSHHSFF